MLVIDPDDTSFFFYAVSMSFLDGCEYDKRTEGSFKSGKKVSVPCETLLDVDSLILNRGDTYA